MEYSCQSVCVSVCVCMSVHLCVCVHNNLRVFTSVIVVVHASEHGKGLIFSRYSNMASFNIIYE